MDAHTIIHRSKRLLGPLKTIQLVIPISGQLLREFDFACAHGGTTKVAVAWTLIEDFVASAHAADTPVELPGMRIELGEEA